VFDVLTFKVPACDVPSWVTCPVNVPDEFKRNPSVTFVPVPAPRLTPPDEPVLTFPLIFTVPVKLLFPWTTDKGAEVLVGSTRYTDSTKSVADPVIWPFEKFTWMVDLPIIAVSFLAVVTGPGADTEPL
jgi:hypothetical protein